jgi:formate hydrogenlyase subunit 3/multisubunit Na+/H+ antiporter MnhD subunit
MPLAYTAAPVPAASTLSGAAVKAGVIGLIRFLPFGVPLEGWGEALVAVGFVSAFYGVAVGLTQENPKTVLAYSSVSQMGVIAAALGAALATGDASTPIGVSFYAANHVLVKGVLFLTIGALAGVGTPRSAPMIALAAALALSLAGLPFTGGALAKLAVKTSLSGGFVGMLANASAVASALLMLHFLSRVSRWSDGEARADTGRTGEWVIVALGAIFFPWLLYPRVGAVTDALSLAAIWEALWPVLVGAVLAFGLRRWSGALPRIPAGDTVVLAESGFMRSLTLGSAFERIDAGLRQWIVAGLSLGAIALLLALAPYAR